MHQNTTIIVMIALVIFGLYRRVRRTVGFQYLMRGRLTYRVVIFSILALVILAGGMVHPLSYAFDAGGIALGSVIAYLSIRTTRFEVRDGRWGYLQHTWIGITLIALFVGRLAFRFAEIPQEMANIQKAQAAGQHPTASPGFADPWTSSVFMLLVAYYIIYFTYLLRKERELTATTPVTGLDGSSRGMDGEA